MRIPGLVKAIRIRRAPAGPLTMRVPPLRMLEQAVQRLRTGSRPTDPRPLSLLMVNLDRFRLVNDLCGHAAGDRLIEIVHERCTQAQRRLHVLHIGADEFACLLPVEVSDGHAGERKADEIAARLLRGIGEPVSLGRHIVHPTASIGIVTDRFGTFTAEELLRGASIALSHAKLAGGGAVRRFSSEMFASLTDRAALEEDLRGGVMRGELVPYYQPIVSLATRRLVRFEALVRWEHPERGVLGPDSFLSIAEDVGLNDELLFSMVRQCCRDAREWEGDFGVSVNMSPRQICDPAIASRLLQIVFASGLDAERLTVEITENALMHNITAAQTTVAMLREAGIGIALDDFGAGYASLNRMCQFPLDMLKIDRTLVQSIDRDAGRKLLKVVVDLGQSLAMPVTAEGIETQQQALYLKDLGCAFGQGYLFGRPVPAAFAARLTMADPEALAS